MKEINFYASIFNQTGYDNHSRQLVNALYRQNDAIYLECPKPQDWIRRANSREMAMMGREPFHNATDICINLPPFWQLYLAQRPKHFIGWCVWEGTNIPKYFLGTMKDARVNAIISPSQHTKTAILNTCDALKEKLFVVPHGVDSRIFRPMKVNRSDKFTFIANKGWAQSINDRGGIQWLVKAFCEEFKQETDVELLCKINIAYNMPNWNLFNELMKIDITPEMSQNVKFIPQNIEYDRLGEFYNQGDVFVSPTMGDAFNLPVLEAMSCGIPAIVTDFGGQTDYVNQENGWLVGHELVDVTWDIMYENCRWGMPDLANLRQKMRYCYEHKDECKKNGQAALQTSQELSWDNSARHLINLMNEF